MKTPPSIIFLLAVACISIPARAENPDPSRDTALFSNGDTLLGNLLGCDTQGLHWKTAYGESILVTTKFLTEIRIHTHDMPAKVAPSPNDAIFINGDTLSGTLASFDGKSFLFDTWYAGRLTLPREALRAISASASVYSGPADMDGWVADPDRDHGGAWTCANGVLSSGSLGIIGRDFKLPTLARIQFDLELSGPDGSGANIFICGDRASNPGEFYEFPVHIDGDYTETRFGHYSRNSTMSIISSWATLEASKPKPAADPDGSLLPETGLQPPPAPTSRKFHFDIRIDRAAKTIRLYVDGRLVQEYSHLDDLPSMGGALLFSPVNNETQLRIAGIQVGAWSGGGDDDAGEARPAVDDDSIEIASGAPVHGKLKRIDAGKAIIATANGDVEIPVPQITSIMLATPGGIPPKPAETDIRAYLFGHGHVTLQFNAWDEKGAGVTSPDFGKATFLPGVFIQLEFNVGAPPPPVQPPAYSPDQVQGAEQQDAPK